MFSHINIYYVTIPFFVRFRPEKKVQIPAIWVCRTWTVVHGCWVINDALAPDLSAEEEVICGDGPVSARRAGKTGLQARLRKARC